MSALFYVAIALLLLLAAHHGVKVRRGLRSEVIEGLVLGYPSKAYRRADQPVAFWVNIAVGMFVATLGVLAILWAVFLVAMIFSDHPL